MRYDKYVYRKLLINADLHGAVDYLSLIPEKAGLVKRYLAVFERGETIKRSANGKIRAIDEAYQEYYRNLFWRSLPHDRCKRDLCAALSGLLDKQYDAERQADTDSMLEAVERDVEHAVENEGHHFLGGTTSGRYGPYIWKTTEPVTYDICLPSGMRKFTVNMLDGFVSLSWLDYLSFGKIGTGGWVSGQNGDLFCVRKAYKKILDKPKFTVSYLKHEAQHAYDREHIGADMTPVQLEYRAKLTELIYYPDLTMFRSILNEANESDKTNSHPYASYLILRNLSEAIFGGACEWNYRKWYGKLPLIREAALRLFNEYPDHME